MPQFDPLAVVAAALSNFAVGALWYSPFLFGHAWLRASGIAEDDVRRGGMLPLFAGAGLCALVMAANLAAFTNPAANGPAFTVAAAVAAGFGWAAMGLAIVGLFERRPWRWIAIHAGYLTVSFAAMGLVLGLLA